MSTPAANKKKGPTAPIRLYLIIYNLLSAFGWGYVVFQVFSSLFSGKNAVECWEAVGLPLTIVQTTAMLEIFHSIARIVPSAWLTTFIQVMSRLIVLWTYTIPHSHQHWSLYLLAGSWATVEVPRYLFYVWSLVFPDKQAPGVLFHLRYSLFAILYPTGITGEILQLWNSQAYWGETFNIVRIINYVLLFVLYPPLSPFMYMHMVVMRKKQIKRRNEALNQDKQGNTAATAAKPPAKPQEGLLFPLDPETNEVSTSSTGKAVFAASIKPVSPTDAESICKERNWRFGYAKHVVRHVDVACQSKDNAVAMAKAGLDYCYKNFRFIRDGQSCTLENALTRFKDTQFLEGKLVGSKKTSSSQDTPLVIPYKNKHLAGKQIDELLEKWVKVGTIEPSCRDAISWAAHNVTSLSDHYFVLLGAGAAMGPLEVLLSLGANIIAIDLDRPQIWQRILSRVKDSSSTVYFPMKSKPANDSIDALAEVAGSNLMTQTPEIAQFVANILPGKKLVIGSYAYLDSAAHVQVSLSMDAIVKTSIAVRGKDLVIPAYLCSPTDVFMEDKATYDAARHNFKNATWYQKLFIALGQLKPNGVQSKQSPDVYINDGIVVPQGPNYALAKRIQHWRAVACSADNMMVSSNIAPSTATASVVSNVTFQWAYNGMKFFKPMEVMMQETSNAVMGALLIHDIVNVENSPKNPRSPQAKESGVAKQPMLQFAQGAFHGGIWRLGFHFNAVGTIAAGLYFADKYKFIPAIAVAGVAAFVKMVGPHLP